MNKKELINTLKMFERNIRLFDDRGNYSGYLNGKKNGYKNAIELVERLDEPKKAELTQKEADWIVQCKDFEEALNYTLKHFNASEQPRVARAIINGYTIKKEPRYYIRLIKESKLDYLNLNTHTGRRQSGGRIQAGDYQTQFTEAEIKAIDPRYWPFAEKVEEAQ